MTKQQVFNCAVAEITKEGWHGYEQAKSYLFKQNFPPEIYQDLVQQIADYLEL